MKLQKLHCKKCGKEYFLEAYKVKYRKGFCSTSCSSIGRPNATKGLKRSVETRKRMGLAQKKRLAESKNHPRWIEDRTKIAGFNVRQAHDPESKLWRKRILARDGNRCKVNDAQCKGRLEVHHILAWKEYPELRYQNNNGITLCHFHHPRRKEDEEKLSSYFQKLVAEMK